MALVSTLIHSKKNSSRCRKIIIEFFFAISDLKILQIGIICVRYHYCLCRRYCDTVIFGLFAFNCVLCITKTDSRILEYLVDYNGFFDAF